MTDPTARISPGVSHHPPSLVGGVSTERIDVGAMPIGPVDGSQFSMIGSEIFHDRNSNNEPSQLTQPEVMPPVVGRTKAKARFSKRKVLANASVFLNPTYRGFFTDNLVEIVGKIEECPRSVNNHRYRIDWRKNDGKPLPSQLSTDYLQEYYDNTAETKEILQNAIGRYDEVYGKSGGGSQQNNVLPNN